MGTLSAGALADFLSQETLGLQIGGASRAARGGDSFEVLNPADGSRLASVAAGTAADVDDAVTAAENAFPAWSGLSAVDRAVHIHRFADLLDEHAGELALLESLDVGKVLTDAKGFDIPFGTEAFRFFADLSVHARHSEPLPVKGIEARQLHLPYGACGFVLPWNFPFLLLAWNIAPALAAGNTVVVKPAELTPLSTLFAGQLAREAGIPAGVLNVVTGFGQEAGAALAGHPRIKRIAFTGSPEIGRAVAQAASANLVPAKLELGGKGAAVVFDDVDIKQTASSLSGSITLNSGQVCCTATRWVVQRSIFDEFVAEAKAVLEASRLGAGQGEDTTLGPVVSAGQRQRILGYLENGCQQGASFLLEGGPAQPAGLEAGFFVKPALLTGPRDNVCVREEIFGPVAYVLPFDRDEDAVELVNESLYGLANSVWSDDLLRANALAEKLVAGNSWINAHNVFAYGLPYAGVNLSGLGGGVNSAHTYHDYLRDQTIGRPLT